MVTCETGQTSVDTHCGNDYKVTRERKNENNPTVELEFHELARLTRCLSNV